MAFVERQIDLVFTPAQNATTPGPAGSAVTVSGLRTQVHIEKAGAYATGNATVTVYGMQLSLMNQFSSLGPYPTLQQPNQLSINAGDAGSPLSTVFEGTIQTAWVDASDPANVAFRIEAFAYFIETVSPGKNRSYAGAVDLAQVMADIALEMNLSFENDGVSVISYNPVFQGSPQDQANACAKQGAFNWIPDVGVLAIWPRGGSRKGIPVPITSESMQGFPTYQSYGIQVRTLLNVAIQSGRLINVQSQVSPTTLGSDGTWAVNSLIYDLSANVPGGPWHMEISAYRPGAVPGTAPQ